MKLPKLKKPLKYAGLYVFDFGDHAGVGFTAGEVAELFESEKYADCKAYKIIRASPDGTLELKGVPAQTFQLESGLFFHSTVEDEASGDFERLLALAGRTHPPCRTKAVLARYGSGVFATAVIYPAEYDEEVGKWLQEGQYRTKGQAEGGTGAVQRHYDLELTILRREQFFADERIESRKGKELLSATKMAVQR
jgi:hypothetical protein